MPVINRANAHGDADQVQRTLIGERDTLLRRVLRHDFESELAAIGIGHPAVLDAVASLFQLVDGHFEHLAVGARAVCRRQGVGAGQQLRRHGLRRVAEQRQFARVGGVAIGAERRVLPVALRPLEGAAEDVFVHPLEIEGIGKAFAYLFVSEDGTAGVEDETEHAGRQARLEHVLDDIAAMHGGEIIGLPPVGGIGGAIDGIAFRVDVDIALLEGLEHGRDLEEIGDADLVVIIETDFAGNVLAPVVGVSLPDDSFTRAQRLDSVRAGADNRTEARLLEFFRIGRVFRQDRR